MTKVEAFLADFPINTAMNQSLSEADRLSKEHTPAPKAEISVSSSVLVASELITDPLKAPCV